MVYAEMDSENNTGVKAFIDALRRMLSLVPYRGSSSHSHLRLNKLRLFNSYMKNLARSGSVSEKKYPVLLQHYESLRRL